MSTVHLVLSWFGTVLAWSFTHPQYSVPIVGAVASLFYKRVDKSPRGHALLAMFASVGWDLPRFQAMAIQLVTGKAVPPPSAGGGSGPGAGTPMLPSDDLKTVPPPPPAPPVNTRNRRTFFAVIGGAQVALALSFVLAQCGGAQDLGPASPLAVADYTIQVQKCDQKARAMKADAGPDSGWFKLGYDCIVAEHEKHCGDGGDWLDAESGVCDAGILNLGDR